jgi:hypothetical protein
MNATVKQMVEEIRTDLANGEELDEIKDRSGEIVDGYLPVYYNRILEEWKEMPNEYTDRGSAELGHLCQEISIFNLMSLDLYLYYTDLFNEAVEEIEEEIEQSLLEAFAEKAN